jgi:hypothetical protein
MQLWQIQSKAQPITPPGSEGERITPDKWQPNTNTPQSNWQAAKVAAMAAVVLAPVLAFTNLGQPERTTPDKYRPVVKEVFTLPQNQFQYPTFFYHPRPVSAAETISVDKWFREAERPRFDAPRNQHLYQNYADPTQAFRLNETIKVFNGVASLITFNRTTLYQSRAFTEQAMATAETVTVDKWFARASEPVLPPKNHTWVTQSALELSSTQRPELVSLDRWQQPQSQPRFDIARQQWRYPSLFVDSKQLTQTERITPDKWLPLPNQPLFDVKRTQLTYSFFFFHAEPQEVTQFESPSEFARNVDRVYDIPRNQYLYPSFATDAKLLTQKEAVSFDKWNFNTSIPRFDVARNQFLYPPFSTSPQALTQAERSTPDKWLPLPNQPLFSVKRQPWTYPTLFFNPKPLPVAEFLNLWAKQPEQILVPGKPLAHLYPSFVTDAKGQTQPENVSLDRFQQPQSLPKWDFARNQYLFPSEQFNPFAIGTSPTFIVAAVQPQDQPLFDYKRQQHIYPLFTGSLAPITPPEPITTDKWHPLIAQPLFDVKRAQWIYPVWIIDPKHLLDHEVTTMKWYRATEQPFFIPEQHRYIREYFAEYAIAHPWRLTDRTTDASYNDVSRSSDATYSEVSRSSDATYSEVSRPTDANYTQVNRDSDDDWNRLSREN